jgi:hypothetical protein
MVLPAGDGPKQAGDGRLVEAEIGRETGEAMA